MWIQIAAKMDLTWCFSYIQIASFTSPDKISELMQNRSAELVVYLTQGCVLLKLTSIIRAEKKNYLRK